MAIKQLFVSFECADASKVLALSDLTVALSGVQRAVHNMVEYMAGVEPPTCTRPMGWTHRESVLSLQSLSADSLVAELILRSSMNGQLPYADGRDYGGEAIDAILDWQDGNSRRLPYEVSNALMGIYDNMSLNVCGVALYNPRNERRLSIPRDFNRETVAHYEKAIVRGYLMEVDWAKNTARLDDTQGDKPVPLEFGDELNGDMQRFAKQFIQVVGSATLDITEDEWVNIKVEKIIGDRSPYEPFDIRELDRNPKVFHSDDMRDVELFESDEELNDFIRIIRESRNR